MCRKKCITDLLVRVLPPWVISDAAWRKTTQAERSTVTIFQDLSGDVEAVVSCHRFIFEVASLCHWDTASSAAFLSHLNGVIRKINFFLTQLSTNPSTQPTRHRLSLIQNESHQYQAVELRLKSDFEFHTTSNQLHVFYRLLVGSSFWYFKQTVI